MKYLLTLIVVLGLLFAGCSSAPSETQSEANADAQAQPAASDSSASTTTPTPSATAKVADELEKLLLTQSSLEYFVEYKLTSKGNGQDASGTMATYMDGFEKMRFDAVMNGMETRTYIVDKKFTSCTKYGDGWNCFSSTSDDSDSDSYELTVETNEDLKENIDTYDVVKMPDRTIAGARASCYRITMPDSVVDYCYSSDAVPLYTKSVSTDEEGETYTSEMEATSYSKSVSASAFVPPESTSSGPSQADIDAMMAQYATGYE